MLLNPFVAETVLDRFPNCSVHIDKAIIFHVQIPRAKSQAVISVYCFNEVTKIHNSLI